MINNDNDLTSVSEIDNSICNKEWEVTLSYDRIAELLLRDGVPIKDDMGNELKKKIIYLENENNERIPLKIIYLENEIVLNEKRKLTKKLALEKLAEIADLSDKEKQYWEKENLSSWFVSSILNGFYTLEEYVEIEPIFNDLDFYR